jgi:hypothetical protein
MAQMSLLLKVVGLSGIATVAASTHKPAVSAPTPRVQAPPLAPAAATVGWLRTFGSYNVRQGTLNLFQDPNGC